MKAKPEILTLRQVAEVLHCSPSTLYQLARRGDIPAFRLGGWWRFQARSLDEWIARRTRREPE
jgi:excisionase family DNA binding protein